MAFDLHIALLTLICAFIAWMLYAITAKRMKSPLREIAMSLPALLLALCLGLAFLELDSLNFNWRTNKANKDRILRLAENYGGANSEKIEESGASESNAFSAIWTASFGLLSVIALVVLLRRSGATEKIPRRVACLALTVFATATCVGAARLGLRISYQHKMDSFARALSGMAQERVAKGMTRQELSKALEKAAESMPVTYERYRGQQALSATEKALDEISDAGKPESATPRADTGSKGRAAP